MTEISVVTTRAPEAKHFHGVWWMRLSGTDWYWTWSFGWGWRRMADNES